MSRSTPHPLHLSGDLSLRTIADLHAELQRAVAAHDAITVSTGSVDSIDIAAIQLLVSAARTAAAAEKVLTVTAAADSAFGRALVGAGLFSGDGRPLVATLSHWTITREAA
jgi:ABC-type transporter Mla MlaB component